MDLMGSIELVDCTLREGEQSAGVWFSVEEKLQLVDRLAAVGLKRLDAGMPAVSPDEKEFLRRAVGRSEARIGASVRALTAEVQLAIDCGVDEIFVICPVSELHRTKRLGLSATQLLQRIESLVIQGQRANRQVNLVAEDASRTDFPFLIEALQVALDHGAEALYLCDTVGLWRPSVVAQIVTQILEELPNAPLGIHCHNDFGMATANTVAAIEAGIRYPTATINGVGERSGNASLIEVATAAQELLGLDTGLAFELLGDLSALVERLTGFVVPQHSPLVGFNAFRHESGIHVDGLLKDPGTYQSIDPQLVGRKHDFVVGKHSGRALLRRFAVSNGWPDDDETVALVLEAIKSRRPDWARESFERVRTMIDNYNRSCLGVGESALEALFAEHSKVRKCQP
jgi:isopropylmalate/homocitrate/citramalate synthase